MPRIKLSDELKEAIASLPDKEKNKYLFRLIAKESLLVDQLTYRLLENSETQVERREALRETIQEKIRERSTNLRSPNYLTRDLRRLSGAITRHLRTTKDTYGEVELNFCMLNYSFELMGARLQQYTPNRTKRMDSYVVKRAKKLLVLLSKMHPDYRLDFDQDLKDLQQYMEEQDNMMEVARILDFDVEELTRG
ncbi:MAG: hypothetical protein AAGJ93_03385 [Bacteroidota bacterium]